VVVRVLGHRAIREGTPDCLVEFEPDSSDGEHAVFH
jgi:hypothetical protein